MEDLNETLYQVGQFINRCISNVVWFIIYAICILWVIGSTIGGSMLLLFLG